MTIQEGPDTFKEKAVRKNWPSVEGTDFGTTIQTKEPNLIPEKDSFVNRVGKKGFQ